MKYDTTRPIRYDTERLFSARLEKGWSQKRLAAIVDVHQTTISQIEKGKIEPPETIKKLADALDIPMSELIIRNEEVA